MIDFNGINDRMRIRKWTRECQFLTLDIMLHRYLLWIMRLMIEAVVKALTNAVVLRHNDTRRSS